MWYNKINNAQSNKPREMTAAFYLFVEFCAVSGGLTDISEKKLYSLYLSERRKKNRAEHHCGKNKTNPKEFTLWYELLATEKLKSKSMFQMLLLQHC